MTTELPAPKSRKESYLAKAAGEDVTIPEKPLSRTEQYLAAIAEGGGGGGGTSDFDQLTNRPKYNGAPMTGETNIPESTTYTAGDGIDIVAGVIKATNTGKARLLTMADYNWNSTSGSATEPYDCIAAWLLDDGMYTFDRSSVDIRAFKDNAIYITNSSYYYMLVTSGGNRKVFYAFGASESLSIRQYVANMQSGYEGNYIRAESLLKENQVVQTTGTSTTDVMSQKAVTDAIAAIPTGGGITELTSADYNYDYGSTGTDNAIALWLLDSGIYSVKEPNIPIRINTSLGYTTGIGNFIVGAETTDTQSRKFILYLLRDSDGVYHDGVYIVRASNGTGIDGKSLDPPTVVQTTGTSTTSVMSQNAVTSMVFADPSTKNDVLIGNATARMGGSGVAIGNTATVGTNAWNSVAIGRSATSNAERGVAIGAYSKATSVGEFSIGDATRTDLYGGTGYRLLTNVHGPVSAHDAATKGYVDGKILSGAGAPTTSTAGTVGQVYQDTTNGKLYICTAIVPGTDPDPDTYTWAEVGAGGGGGGATVLTSADYNYHASGETDDGIALWLLPSGNYATSGALKLYTHSSNSYTSGDGYTFFIITAYDSSTHAYKGVRISTSGDLLHLQNISEIKSGVFDKYNNAGILTYSQLLDTTGTSTADVMSQNAVTSMVYADPSTKQKVQIGASAFASGNYTIALGGTTSSDKSISIGSNASASGIGSIALGRSSSATRQGEMNIGSSDTSAGFNSSNYRLLTGLYDGQSAHDAVNLGQLQNAIINGGTTAPTTTTVGAVGTQYTYVDTTGTPTAHLCVCTEIDTTDPSNPVYTWSTLI